MSGHIMVSAVLGPDLTLFKCYFLWPCELIIQQIYFLILVLFENKIKNISFSSCLFQVLYTGIDEKEPCDISG